MDLILDLLKFCNEKCEKDLVVVEALVKFGLELVEEFQPFSLFEKNQLNSNNAKVLDMFFEIISEIYEH